MTRFFPTFGPTAEREPFWFLGGRAKILLPGTATDNRLSLTEFTDPAGHAPRTTSTRTRRRSGSSWTVR
ncbi:hypothetical protein ACGF3G_03000 [Streptomyces sp. NPDC048179]|uniref:hypothetical protein n=1 Tax=Streptomyces sp. NPDC048179 TaxID=3365506 RepID=UPI0037124570